MPTAFASLTGQKTFDFRLLSRQYFARLLWLDQLCAGRVIECDQCGLTKPLLLFADQAPRFQFPEYPRRALPTAVQFLLCLFNSEIKTDRAVCLYKAIDL